ncbi:MAG: multidrug effflux MFS transporter [Pseudolabrys sp.]
MTDSVPAAVPPRKRFLVLLVALSATGPVALNIFVPAIPQLTSRFNTDAATVQLTLSLFLLSLASGQLLLGPLSDRFGRRPVVLGGIALACIASFAAMAAPSIEWLIAARVAQALGAGTGIVISRAIVRDLYDRDRAAAMLGLVTSAMVIAPMVAPMIGGLLDTVFGWESIFLAVSIVTLIVLIWSTAALPETNPLRMSGADSSAVSWREWRALLTNRRFYRYALTSTFGTAPYYVLIGGAPHVVVNIIGATSAEYGVWFTLSSLGYMIGNFIASRLSTRYGVHTMIKAGIGLGLIATTAAVALLATVGTEIWIFFVPQLFVSVGNGLLLPNSIAAAISVRPQAAGAASGITGFLQMSTGAAIAQGISYILVHDGGPLSVPLMMIGVLLVALVFYYGLRDKSEGR